MATIPAGYAQVGIKLTNDFSTHTSYITWGASMSAALGDVLDARETIAYALPDILQDVSSSITAQGVNFTFEVDGEKASVYLPFGTPLVGAMATDKQTPQVAYLYKKTTASIGRGTSGRFYMPGTNEPEIDASGLLGSAFWEDAMNHAATFLEKLNTGDPEGAESPLPMYLFHDGVALEVVQLTISQYCATQRRRLVRGA